MPVKSGLVYGLTLALAGVVAASTLTAHADSPAAASSRGLPLGAPGLSEERVTTTVQPGVTLARITRGAQDPALSWTVEVSIPGGEGSPDPDAPATALSDQDSARRTADDLSAQGFAARAERVRTPRTTDFTGGTLGWRVRVGTFGSRTEADAERTRLAAEGTAGSSVYTGWDGEPGDRGPWRVEVVTIDPKRFTGGLDASFGPDLERRETTSALASAAGATVGVNAGFFVLDPAAGAPGDPAGVTVENGALLSEPVGTRPALVLRDDARRTSVDRFSWRGRVSAGRTRLAVDGINRVPGKVRNCGGTGDSPTDLARHDFTCTDIDEVVMFTKEYGASTPSGPGTEVVLDRRGTVTERRATRGGSLPGGSTSLQATGAQAAKLRAAAPVGRRLRVSNRLVDPRGRTVRTSARTSVLNGGPELVRDGRLFVTPRTDGMVHPDNPSFYYGWAHKRNPRTLAGTDARGRLLLATIDGRSSTSLGLSITESAAVAKALGMRDAINLDGGGSTTMVVDGAVINEPSDGAERPVGDALLVSPRRCSSSCRSGWSP